MRQTGFVFGLFGALALAVCGTQVARAQCTDYTIVAGPATYVSASTDIGNHDDEAMTAVTLPFSVSLYGMSFDTANVSSNGFIEFGSDGQASSNSCLPLAPFDFTFLSFSNPTVVICPYWADLSTYNSLDPDNGKGVFTSLSGDPGSQDFVIEWRAFDNGLTDTTVFFEVIFHENQSHFDVVYFNVPAIGNATVGVQLSSLDPSTFAITRTATQYECFANTRGASAIQGFGATSLRFLWCETTVGACCDPAAACILAASPDSCQGNAQFMAGAACSPSPCPAPENDACANAIDIGSLFFPNDPNPIDNGAAASDATDCSAALRGVWYTYTAQQDCELRCASIGSQNVAWAVAPDCSTTPHCLPGGSNSSIQVNAGQTVQILATNATPEANPAAALQLVFNPRTAVSDSTCTIVPGTAALIPGDTDSGNHTDPGDDVLTPITFPFPVSLYGVPYTTANASNNGYIEFSGMTSFPSYLCMPVSNLPDPAIFVYREEMVTSTTGGKGIFTGVSGSPGSRVFVVEWRTARFSAEVSTNTIQIRCEAVFYENQPYFDLVYDTIPAFGGATVGVQASAAGPATQFECNADADGLTDLGGGLSLRFNMAVTGACCDSTGVCTTQSSLACPAPSSFISGASCSAAPCPAPQNDTCDHAINLNGHVYSATPTLSSDPVMANLSTPYKVTEYVGSAGDDAASCPIFHGVWFTYTAPTQGVLLLNQASGGGTNTAVWATSPDCSTTPTCPAVSTGSSVKVPVAAGQTIYLLAGMPTETIDPTMPLVLTFALLPDECNTALPLTPPTTEFGWFLHATATAGGAANVCNDATNRDLWYAIDVTRTGEYVITAASASAVFSSTPAIDLYSACGGTSLGCAIKVGSTNAVIDVQLTPGTYPLRVASTGTIGLFRVDITAPPCAADFNNNGQLSVQDIFDFLSAWFAGDPRADFNGVNGIGVQDIFDFLSAWFAGC